MKDERIKRDRKYTYENVWNSDGKIEEGQEEGRERN